MGKNKKGYNWRAREQPGGQLDSSQVASLQDIVQIPGMRADPSQGTNILGKLGRRIIYFVSGCDKNNLPVQIQTYAVETYFKNMFYNIYSTWRKINFLSDTAFAIDNIAPRNNTYQIRIRSGHWSWSVNNQESVVIWSQPSGIVFEILMNYNDFYLE